MSAAASPYKNRFAFMVAVVPYLVDKGSATLQELADRFELGVPEVKRLVETIAMSGVPGETSTYQDNDLFDIDWDAFDNGEVILTRTIAIDRVPRLSNVEVAAIIAGLRLLDSSLDASTAAVAESVLRKLNVTPSAQRTASAPSRDDLRVLRNAIEQRHSVRFRYVDARGEVSLDRVVDPLWVDRNEQAWYLRGWSHSSAAVRTFRVERISDLVDTGEVFGAHPLAPLELSPDAGVRTAVVRVHPTALGFLSWYVDAERRVDPITAEVVAEISYSSLDALVRSIMAYPGRVHVDVGDEVRAAISARAAKAIAGYRSSE